MSERKSKIGNFFKKVVGALPNLAGDVLSIATSPNPLGTAVQTLTGKLKGKDTGKVGDQLLGELQGFDTEDWKEYELKDRELDLQELGQYLQDRANARDMYKAKNTMADFIAKRVFTMNLYFIIGLAALNIGVILFLDDKVLVSLVGTLVGMIIRDLLNERSTLINFFFGTSFSNEASKDTNTSQ